MAQNDSNDSTDSTADAPRVGLRHIVARAQPTQGARAWIGADLPRAAYAGDAAAAEAAAEVEGMPIGEAGALIAREDVAEALASARIRASSAQIDAAMVAAAYALSSMAAEVLRASVAAVADTARSTEPGGTPLDRLASELAAAAPRRARRAAEGAALGKAIGADVDPGFLSLACGTAVGNATLDGERHGDAATVAARVCLTVAAEVRRRIAEAMERGEEGAE